MFCSSIKLISIKYSIFFCYYKYKVMEKMLLNKECIFRSELMIVCGTSYSFKLKNLKNELQSTTLIKIWRRFLWLCCFIYSSFLKFQRRFITLCKKTWHQWWKTVIVCLALQRIVSEKIIFVCKVSTQKGYCQ